MRTILQPLPEGLVFRKWGEPCMSWLGWTLGIGCQQRFSKDQVEDLNPKP